MIVNNIFTIVQKHFNAASCGVAKPLLFYSESFDEFIAYINEVILYQSIGTLQGHAVHSPVVGPPPVVTRPTLIISQHLTSTDIVKRIVCAQILTAQISVRRTQLNAWRKSWTISPRFPSTSLILPP